MTGINLTLFEPDSNWKPQLKFPNLGDVRRMVIDLETKDPNIENKGPGSIRRDGYPVGVSIATNTGFKAYYPFDHTLGGNLPKENIVNFLCEVAGRADIEKVCANFGYDLEWLRFMGITLKGQLRCVQIAESLIDEESLQGYNLSALGQKYLGFKKNEELLKLAASTYGVDPKGGLHQLHSKYVGPYAEADAAMTLAIYEKQEEVLTSEGIWSVFNMECELLQIVLEMRMKGVRVDLDAADRLRKELKQAEDEINKSIRLETGFNVNPMSSADIVKVCKKLGYEYSLTEKGNPSFDKNFLKNSDNSFFKKILQVRNLKTLRCNFIETTIFGNHVNGRIHAEFHQTRSDEDGTRTGRFAVSNPNLQQIPSRHEFAHKIRALFLPDVGEKWAKLDYSQQEPRILTHYGFIMKLLGADKIRDAYLADKKTDFYPLVAKAAGLPRKPAKDLTLGICYGEGKDKISKDLGFSPEKSMEVMRVFNEANPFIKQLSDICMDLADRRGYIKTLLGRKRRFNLWELKRKDYKSFAMPLEKARQKWPNAPLKRAYTYKALNALIQGSAADMTKAAMIQNYKQHGEIPLLTVHDELDHSVTCEEQALKIQHVMENCVQCTVPIYAELELGDHWK
jgi:DNA polymerase I-like protein with 3'-5' exonuclease and polymerase domains